MVMFKMKQLYTILLLSTIVLLFSSCKEEFSTPSQEDIIAPQHIESIEG